MQLTSGNQMGGDRVTGTETSRDPYFEAVYAEVQQSISSGGVLRGSAFWRLALDATNVRSLLSQACVVRSVVLIGCVPNTGESR